MGSPTGWLTTVNPINDTPPLDNDALDGSDGVVTTCALAIAQTGTIVLDGGPGMGRRALTLLPDYHLCVVRTEQIVPSVPEALALLEPTRPLTFISGPVRHRRHRDGPRQGRPRPADARRDPRSGARIDSRPCVPR